MAHSYADDTQVYISTHASDRTSATQLLSIRDPALVGNRLKLNEDAELLLLLLLLLLAHLLTCRI